MTDREWATGWAELMKSGLPGWPTEEGEAGARVALYRRRLDDLSGMAWIAAVDEAIDSESWFPTIAKLREYAETFRPKLPVLPPARRTEEEKAEARETARRGLELIKAEMEKRQVLGEPAKEMP